MTFTRSAISGGARRLTTWACLCGGLSALLLLDGCGDPPGTRRQGLGGGALSPVQVTLLRTDTSGKGESGAGGAAPSGAKIETFGTFKGKISVTGGAPNLPPLVQGQKLEAAKCPASSVPNESALVGSDGGLANVFVYLRKVPNVDVPSPPAEPVVIDQKGCRFVPHALIVRVGQPLKMINSDPVAHNVMFNASTFSFNNTVNAHDLTGLEVTYTRGEAKPIPSSCSFHGWMQAYQLALDHPWSALTGEDGTFVIENVPAGKMEFVIWHEKLGYIEKSLAVEIPANGTLEKTLEVSAANLAAP